MNMSKIMDTVKLLPWVTYLTRGGPCDGLKYNAMPGRATRRWGPKGVNPPTGTEKYRCKNPARWRFRALKSTGAQSGTYCWPHLWSIGLGTMGEEARAERWLKKHGHDPYS